MPRESALLRKLDNGSVIPRARAAVTKLQFSDNDGTGEEITSIVSLFFLDFFCDLSFPFANRSRSVTSSLALNDDDDDRRSRKYFSSRFSFFADSGGSLVVEVKGLTDGVTGISSVLAVPRLDGVLKLNGSLSNPNFIDAASPDIEDLCPRDDVLEVILERYEPLLTGDGDLLGP